MTGDRPAHLERCDLCAERAKDASRWLDEVHTVATAAADTVFTPERLSAQQATVMRRLEQMDEPSRVIAFPGQTRPMREGLPGRRVAPAWVGVAAAAGLALGVVGGQLTARMTLAPAPQVVVTAPEAPTAADPVAPLGTSTGQAASRSAMGFDVLSLGSSPELDYEHMGLPTVLSSVDSITPKIVPASLTVRARN